MQPGSGRGGQVGIGVIGTGMISEEYLTNLAKYPDVDVLVLGDLNVDRAKAQAQKHGISSWGSGDDVLAHPDVELVINLTLPSVHAEVSLAAIAAGKNVWSEKPIALDRSSARTLLDRAQSAGLLVGVAPDTVLGPGLQTALRLIARGDIGQPLSALTFMQYPGPDIFHPNPEFLFADGAGPLFDVGPYYLTALVHIFGSFSRVSAVGSRGRPTRTIQVGERAGTEFPVSVPTQVSAIAQFAEGAIAQSIFSFESPLARLGSIEVTGSEGTMIVPDPNQFSGTVKITKAATLENVLDEPEWRPIPAVGTHFGRGVGALDMARRIRSGGRPIAFGHLAGHVLETMLGMNESITSGQTIDIASRVLRPPVLPEEWDPMSATLG